MEQEYKFTVIIEGTVPAKGTEHAKLLVENGISAALRLEILAIGVSVGMPEESMPEVPEPEVRLT